MKRSSIIISLDVLQWNTHERHENNGILDKNWFRQGPKILNVLLQWSYLITRKLTQPSWVIDYKQFGTHTTIMWKKTNDLFRADVRTVEKWHFIDLVTQEWIWSSSSHCVAVLWIFFRLFVTSKRNVFKYVGINRINGML